MGALRLVIVLVTAAVAAVALALMVRHLTASKSPAAQAATPPAPPAVRVLVAKRDLKIGERFQPEDAAWQTWPQSAVNPVFVTGGPVDTHESLAGKAQAALQAATAGDPAMQSLTGALVREPMLANEPVSARKLVKGGQGGFMAVKLPAGMRAMSVPITMETGAGGFVLPGDHVDVILNVKMNGSGDMPGGPAQPVKARTVMRNLTVLAIDQAAEPKAGASTLVGTTATLQVPAEDTDTLAKAKEEGTLLLALRSYADMGGPQGAATPPPPAHRPARYARAETIAVRIYRGDKVSELKVP